MTRIVGPNGLPFDVDDVVASGLLGSASGEYKLADAESAPESETADTTPEDQNPADTPERDAPEDENLPDGQVPPAEDYDPADKTLEEEDHREITPESTTSSLDEKPAGNASHERWVEYALSQGKSPDELDGLNRNAVRDLFKE